LADVDDAFDRFRELQLADDVDDSMLAERKRELRKQLEGLRTELNAYLVVQYGRQPTDEDEYARWLKMHLPFHWLVEFHEIMSSAGFDVIVGNPPYVELSAVHGYELRGFHTMAAGNLYALTLERSLGLRQQQGRLGFIIPVSSISTDRYAPLQKLLVGHQLCCSSYDDRPSRLFEGLEHSRLAIHLVGPPADQPDRLSTRYNKWSSAERPALFPTLHYVRSDPSIIQNAIAKLSSPLEHSILRKMTASGGRLADAVTRTGRHEIYYSRKVGYFLQVLDFEPLVRDSQGRRRPPSEFKTLRFERESEATAVLCVLNSNLFYWFVTIFSDCRHVNKREVDAFPIRVGDLADERGTELSLLGAELMRDIQDNSEIRSMTFRHDVLTVQFIYPKKSKPILDRIDAVLAGWYGFSDEELDFITSYDFKYRIGTDDET
jgi:hypothetical protein